MKVLVEGIGSMTFGPEVKYYTNLGWNLVGIDINNHSFGFYTNSIKPYIVPKYTDFTCFDEIEKVIKKEKIDLIFPSVDEGLLEWSRRKEDIKNKYGSQVMISDEKIMEICTDKWKTYLFFKENNIPTPKTSLDMKYDLLKPRKGRGSCGIYKKKDLDSGFRMDNYISQEIVSGEEYTIDVLCDFNSKPIYIIPRKRLNVESGVSVKGMTVYDEKILEYVKQIIQVLKPIGIINIQCFKDKDDIYFIEINPRIAGGSSLSFASSDNWFKAIESFLKNEKYVVKEVKYNNYMFRHYEDIIVQEDFLVR